MRAFQADTKKPTNLWDNKYMTLKIPAKYVFKPEVVKPLAEHGHQGVSCDTNLPLSLQMDEDGLSRGLKSFFIRRKNIEKSQEFDFCRKRSRSLFDFHDRRYIKNGGRWVKPRDHQCYCIRCEKIEDERENTKSPHSCKSQKVITNLRNPEGNGITTTDEPIQDKNYSDRSSFTCLLENQSKKEIKKFSDVRDEHHHLTHTNEFVRNQKGSELRIEENNKVVHNLDASCLRPGSPFPSNNHVDHEQSLIREKDRKKFSTKSLQKSFKNTVKYEGCEEYHWPDRCVNCEVDYFAGNRQLQEKQDDMKQLNQSHEIAVSALLYRSRSLPQLSTHESGLGSGNEQVPGRASSRFVADLRQLLTLKQHYYPEGGWGWVIVVVGMLVHILTHGMHGAVGTLMLQVAISFGPPIYFQAGWLGAMSTGVALLVSPITIAFCRKKSTRLTGVLGGLITALGCLFTSFATQFHQLFFSYGIVVGLGVGITRDCSTLMVAQYFKRRREFVEIFVVSGSGLGITVMSAFIKGTISKMGWRLGLQAVTGVVSLTFILGTFYRSASLYHPQRRAILHLKNQKRKIKDKNKADDRPPFFDFSTLKSKTVRILLMSTGISAFGINTPMFFLAHEAEEDGLGDIVIILYAYLGLAWTLGCVTFGILIAYHNVECRIAKQYLTQTAVFMCGLCILALTTVRGNYHGYVMFTWIYGIFYGGYYYSLKMYTYERVRARNFAKTWGFVQCSQAIPIAIGIPIAGYINAKCGGKAGYYFSSACVLVGSFSLFFINLHRRNLSRHKHRRENGTRHLCVSDTCPLRKKVSFRQEPQNEGVAVGTAVAALALGSELAPVPGKLIDALAVEKPELTCISEEGIADIDLPDNIFDDLDYIGDCITSCNKVENYLMLSEFENNLIAEMPIIMDRKGRRWSLAKSKGPLTGSSSASQLNHVEPEEEEAKPKWQLMSASPPNRGITVLVEAST